MKIKNRLTALYTLVTGLMLLLLLVYIYYFSAVSVSRHFYDDLQQRANSTAQYYLEEDEVEPGKFSQIKERYLHSLPTETVRIYDADDKPAFVSDTLQIKYDAQFIREIRKRKYLEVQQGDRQLVGIYYPDNQGNFVIIVSATDVTGHTRMAQLRLILVLGFFGCLLIVFFLGRFFAKNALTPISRITKRANEITGTNLHLRIDQPKGKDELAELTNTFNQMLKRIETIFESQKTFVHHASHELRTPITSMLVELDVVLEKERTLEEYQTTLRSVLNEVEKLNQLTTGLLNLAKSSFDDPQFISDTIYLDELIVEVKIAAERKFPLTEIQFQFQPDHSAQEFKVHGNFQLLKIALYNLVENACKFSDQQPVLIHLDANSDAFTINIIDLGIGISQADASKVFEPFFRGQKSMSFPGFGIGLSLTQKIITLHKGDIFIVPNSQVKGTTFQVKLPKYK